jgi:hypothetical protein
MSHLYGEALTSWPQMREQARRRSPGGEQLALLEGPDSAATFRTRAYTYEEPVDPASMHMPGTAPVTFRLTAVHPIPTAFVDRYGLRGCGIAQRSALDL